MRKEIIVAIILGSIIGLTLAFGIWRANSALSGKVTEIKNAISNPSKDDKNNPQSSNLSILSPLNEEVFLDSSITFKGITKADSYVLIQTKQENTINYTASGNFEMEIGLETGINKVQVNAYNAEGPLGEMEFTLFYVPNFSKDEEVTASDEAELDPIRQKVQEKISNANNKLVAQFGLITDKTENGLQIKTKQDEIKQVIVNTEDVQIQNLLKTNQKTSFSDVAIGDYVAAIGKAENQSSLEGYFIYITENSTEDGLEAVSGEVTETLKKEIVIKNSVNAENTTVRPITGYRVWELNKEELTKATYNDIETTFKAFASGVIKDGVFMADNIYFFAQAQD